MNAAERIYAASTSQSETASRLAAALAKRVEDDIASRAWTPGYSLGSLREFSERYQVGRSVAREAIGLLERRGLGRMRPGPCGGLILTQPNPQTIAEELANYFRASGISLSQLMDAREAVDLMAIRIACTAAVDPDFIPASTVRPSDDLSGQLAVRLEIARICREPLLELFVACLNHLTLDFAAPGGPPVKSPAGSATAACLFQALRMGTVSCATSFGARLHAELAAWLAEPRTPARSGPVHGTTLPRRARSLPAGIARRLAAEILSRAQTGARLGSESQLCERFNVSRLTLRQAIRLLQDSGLVECRRGRGNGLVVLDERTAGTIRLVLAYFIAGRLDPMVAGTILFQLNCFIPALAVSRATEPQRGQLEASLSRVEMCDPFDRYDLLSLVHCVSRLADSPIIDLFSRCLAAYEARFRPSLAERLPACAQSSYFQLVRRLLDQLPVGSSAALEWAKGQSASLMLEMSRNRPI